MLKILKIYYTPEVTRVDYWGLGVFLLQNSSLVIALKWK